MRRTNNWALLFIPEGTILHTRVTPSGLLDVYLSQALAQGKPSEENITEIITLSQKNKPSVKAFFKYMDTEILDMHRKANLNSLDMLQMDLYGDLGYNSDTGSRDEVTISYEEFEVIKVDNGTT